MTDLRQAAQQALEALTIYSDAQCSLKGQAAITALRTALEQQAEPVCPECKAAVLYECVACSSNNYPPQQQADPVAWMSSDRAWMWSDYSKALAAVAHIPRLTLIPLYTTPPQRPWQGLTPDEVKHLYPYGRSVWGKETFEAIEKALKEKNNAN